MPDIFISYKREDQPAAGQLAAALGNAGWEVWWDPALRAGEHFDQVIEEALASCRCAIVLWSQRSIASQYVRDEASFALRHDKLVPLRLDAAEPPFRFQGLHTLDFTGWNGAADAPVFAELVEDITARIGRPGEPKPGASPTQAHDTPRKQIRTRIAYALGGLLAIAGIVAGFAWRNDGDMAPDCLLAVVIEAVGHDTAVRSLDLRAGGTRRFPVSRGRTTIEIPAAHVDKWQLNVVWDARAPSPVSGLRGCRDRREQLSDDGSARLTITKL